MRYQGTRVFGISIIILLLIASAGISSCEKRVTPKKLTRIIKEDSWRVTSFMFQDTNRESAFVNLTLGFGESGSITVLPSTPGGVGSWNPSLGKKPTLLYISGFVEAPFFYLNDDWTVTTCSKSTIRLESESGAFKNRITLTKATEN